jgi:hypothetical protein
MKADKRVPKILERPIRRTGPKGRTPSQRPSDSVAKPKFKRDTGGVAGNTRVRGVFGLRDMRRAVKRRDKKTVTRAEARKSFLEQAKTALAPRTATTGTGTKQELPSQFKLGRKLAKRGYGLSGRMKKRKRRKAGIGSVTGSDV